jgi:hypothetical protein
MDGHKVDNFHRANPTTEFPRFRHLSSAECRALRLEIAKRADLDPHSDPLVLLAALWAAAEFVLDVDADHGFELRKLISNRNLRPKTEVLVDWQRFDNVDQIALSDLSDYFGDIWYPRSDDIEIFDDSLDWFLFIRHDGAVKILDLLIARNQRP